MGIEFQLGKTKFSSVKLLQNNVHMVNTIVHLKMVKVISFMLYVFY